MDSVMPALKKLKQQSMLNIVLNALKTNAVGTRTTASRGIFRIQSNIYNGAFLQKYLTGKSIELLVKIIKG